MDKYSRHRILWLAIVWGLLFALAVGLLVGLLVPWSKTEPTVSFSSAGSMQTAGSAGPYDVNFQVCASRDAC